MSLRVTNSIEKCVRNVPQSLVVVPAGIPSNSKPTIALPDITQDITEYSGRYIQNVGQSNLYYSIGASPCTPQQFNGILAPAGVYDSNGFGAGQQFDASNDPEQLNVYSPAGTTVAVTLLARRDQTREAGILVANNQGVIQ